MEQNQQHDDEMQHMRNINHKLHDIILDVNK